MNLAYTLFRTARRVPRAVAIIERDRLELDYAQLADRVLALAGGLQSLGVAPGDRVGMLMKNCTQYIELLYACWAMGACAVPINARLHQREVAYILDDADARVCFITEEVDATGIEAARERSGHEYIDVDRSRTASCCAHRRPCGRKPARTSPRGSSTPAARPAVQKE